MEEKKLDVASFLNLLTPKEATVLSMIFGLNEHNSHTIKQISEKLNINRFIVENIKHKALYKLRNPYILNQLEKMY